MLAKINNTANFIKEKTNFSPEIGIILGTGLGGLVNEIEADHILSYEEIPNFPVSTVEGHSGKLIFGTLGGKKVIALQGRFHFYEGYSMNEVVFPVRVMKYLGIKKLITSSIQKNGYTICYTIVYYTILYNTMIWLTNVTFNNIA